MPTNPSSIPTFLPHERHVGSSGFVNFAGGAPKPADVWAQFPDAVIIDGSDDWYAKPEARPELLCQRFEITPLAYFHTGISGISHSGVVLDRADYERFVSAYTAAFALPLASYLAVHLPPAPASTPLLGRADMLDKYR